MAPPSVSPASSNTSDTLDVPDTSSATDVTDASNRSSTADGTVVLDPTIAVGGMAMPTLPSTATKNNKYNWTSTDWIIRWESIAVTAAETNITVGKKNEFTKLQGITVDGNLILATKDIPLDDLRKQQTKQRWRQQKSAESSSAADCLESITSKNNIIEQKNCLEMKSQLREELRKEKENKKAAFAELEVRFHTKDAAKRNIKRFKDAEVDDEDSDGDAYTESQQELLSDYVEVEEIIADAQLQLESIQKKAKTYL